MEGGGGRRSTWSTSDVISVLNFFLLKLFLGWSTPGRTLGLVALAEILRTVGRIPQTISKIKVFEVTGYPEIFVG